MDQITILNSEFPGRISHLCVCRYLNVQFLGQSVANRKTPLEGTPEYYRERAAEMLKKSLEAETDNARNSYLMLASSWDNLAQQLEHPNW
jgi:hypothetical protein